MAKYSLESFEISDIAPDGGEGTAYETIGYVVRNTAVAQQEEGTETEFPLEVEDTPYFSVTTPGNSTFAVDLYAANAEQLAELFGGTYTASPTGDRFDAPVNQIQREVSVRMTQKDGSKFIMPRLKMVCRIEWAFQRETLPLIHVTGTILQPTKAGVAPWSVIDPPAA